jgi:hypothetical protein
LPRADIAILLLQHTAYDQGRCEGRSAWRASTSTALEHHFPYCWQSYATFQTNLSACYRTHQWRICRYTALTSDSVPVERHDKVTREEGAAGPSRRPTSPTPRPTRWPNSSTRTRGYARADAQKMAAFGYGPARRPGRASSTRQINRDKFIDKALGNPSLICAICAVCSIRTSASGVEIKEASLRRAARGDRTMSMRLLRRVGFGCGDRGGVQEQGMRVCGGLYVATEGR